MGRTGRTVIWSICLLAVFVGSAEAQDAGEYGDGDRFTVSVNYFERFVRDGGMITWLILMPMSIATVAMGIQYGLTLRRKVLIPPDRLRILRGLLAAGPLGRVIKATSSASSFVEALLHKALKQLPNGYQAADYALAEAGEQHSSNLQRKIEYLNIIGSVAPMIGLFGTVYGIILAFNKLVEVVRQGGVTQPDQLAEGISVALVTTFWGLIVAIPAMALYGWFRNRIEGLAAEAVLTAQELLQIADRVNRSEQSQLTPAGEQTGVAH